MVNYWNVVNRVVQGSDILLLVLDARYIDETRNREIEDKLRKIGKPILYVINKCDLVDKNEVHFKTKNIRPSVYISAKDHLGTTMLRQKIMSIASKFDFKEIRVGVVGYPNVGKSSIINALKGKASTKVSNISGYTKNSQNVRVSSKLILVDTPGVIPYMEVDNYKHALIGTINIEKLKNPDLMVLEILEKYPGVIEKGYGVELNDDKEFTLDEIAKKKGLLLKGGVPDIDKLSKIILQDIQKGKIK